jgi:hypothetical protein
LEEECKVKADTYQQLSMATDNKLDHLQSVGNELLAVDRRKNLGVRKLVKRAAEKRKFGDVSIRADVQTVQLANYTIPSKSSYTRATSPVNPVYKYGTG